MTCLQLVTLQAVLLLICLIQVDSCSQVAKQDKLVLVPKLARQQDVLLAVPDHLIGDLLEENGHPLRRVVVPSNGVHHLDVVDERGQRVLNCVGSARVHGLKTLLQGGQVFDIVLGLIGSISDLQSDAKPSCEMLSHTQGTAMHHV